MRQAVELKSRRSKLFGRFNSKPTVVGLVLALCALLALPMIPWLALAQAQSVYASGSLSGGNPFVSLDIGGQSTCRLEFSTAIGTLPGGSSFAVNLISVGSTQAYTTNLFDSVGNPHASVNGSSLPNVYTIYAQSAGTVQVTGSGMSTAIVPVSINCSGGGPAFATVTFPSAQPVTCASGCSGGGTATQVTAVPSCPAVAYPCGLPTPIPTLAPSPAATASAGIPPPATAPYVNALDHCYFPSSLGPGPVSNGNMIVQQCDANGNTNVNIKGALPVPISPWPVITPPPTTQVTAVPSCAPGNYPCGLPTPIPTLAPVPAPTATAGGTLPASAPWNWALDACPYNGSNNNANQPTPNPTVGNVIPCQASFDGARLIAPQQVNSQVSVTANGTYLNTMIDGIATCNIKMNPGSGTSATISIKNSSSVVFAGPYSVSGSVNTATFQLVTDAYAVLDSFFIAVTSFSGTNPIVVTLTCSNAPGVVHAYQAGAPWTVTPQIVTTPFPVTTPTVPTPLPFATAASPAPANQVAQGYNAAGPASPVICTHNVNGSISTTLTQIIAVSASKSIYICSLAVTIYGATAGTVQFESGSGTACATSTANVGPPIDFVASATVLTTYSIGMGVGLVLPPIGPTLALCVKSSVAPSAGHFSVMYEQL